MASIEEEARRRLEAEHQERVALASLLTRRPAQPTWWSKILDPDPGPLPEIRPPAWAAGKAKPGARIGPPSGVFKTRPKGNLSPVGLSQEILGARTLEPWEQTRFPGSQP